MMEYKIRKLNLLDIRRMSKILREINMSKDAFGNIVADIFSSATKLSKDKSGSSNIGEFVKALSPALDGLIYLIADSDTFWDFLASLLGVQYSELENIGISEIKDIIAALIGDEQVASFFTSISKAEMTAPTTA